MNNTDNNNNSNETLKVNSKKVLWRKNSSHLPGSILLVSNLSDPSINHNNNSNKNIINEQNTNNSKEFFEYIFTEENWTENLLTGNKSNNSESSTKEPLNKEIQNNINESNQIQTLNHNNKDINSINIKDNSDNNNNKIENNINNNKINSKKNISEYNNNNNDNKKNISEDNSIIINNNSEKELEGINKNNNNNNDNISNDINTTDSTLNINNNLEDNNHKQEELNKDIPIEDIQNIKEEIENLNIEEEDKSSVVNEEKVEKLEIESVKMDETNEYSAHRIEQFEELLNSPNIDLAKLRQLSWLGIPKKFRPMVWQLLMGYLPRNQDRREVTLARKRKDFADTANQAFSKGVAGLDYTLYHQIHIDIPRTNPSCSIYQNKKIQKSLERILYCWAIRHPASGYVQGINDLVTPFYYVFLSSYLDSDLETYDIDSISDDIFEAVEADSFWCLTNLLDGIQDSYTYNQPGIHRQVQKLEEFIKRVDLKLYNHLKKEDVQFIQFAFRWMNCLLMRELKLEHTIRMWDTYQSEPEGFSEFHLYVCAAFLVKWSKQLLEMDFQDIMIFLQNLPTEDWTEKDIEILLSEAYMWKIQFHDSPSHIS